MIYINGDSWSRNLSTEQDPIDWSWPSHFKNLGLEILNESQGCGSNSKIIADLQRNYYLGHRYQLVIVGLTTYHRWHVPARNMSSWLIGPTVLNNRLFKKDETILEWWRKHAHDDLELVYQYYSIIWQINEFCERYFECPVLFFNAWDNDITNIDQMLMNSDDSFVHWMKSKFIPIGQYDFRWESYLKTFEFFKSCRPKWKFNTISWSSLLEKNHYDGPNGRDPGHPNEQGHKIIFDYVLPSVLENLNCNLSTNVI